MALNCFYPGFFLSGFTGVAVPRASNTPFHKSRFFTLPHKHTQRPRHTNVYTRRLLDMAVTRWMTSSPSAAKTSLKPYTHTQAQQLRRSNTFLLCNGKCQSLSMAAPESTTIPSLPPIALIIGNVTSFPKYTSPD